MEPLGFLLAILVAVLTSAKDVATQKATRKNDVCVVAFSLAVFSLPLSILAQLYFGFPEIVTSQFWLAFVVKIPLMVTALIFIAKAHKSSEIGVIVPIIAITPIFMLPVAPFILGQSISWLGMCGVGLIVVGIWTIKIKEAKKGFLAPLKSLFKEAGARQMLVVALAWSITGVIDAYGIKSTGNGLSSAIFWVFTTSVGSMIILFPIIFKKIIKDKLAWKELAPLGLIDGVSQLAQMCAVTMIPVVYVIAIKRLCIVFSVVLGHFLFEEKDFQERVTGSIICVLGAIIIIIFR